MNTLAEHTRAMFERIEQRERQDRFDELTDTILGLLDDIADSYDEDVEVPTEVMDTQQAIHTLRDQFRPEVSSDRH